LSREHADARPPEVVVGTQARRDARRSGRTTVSPGQRPLVPSVEHPGPVHPGASHPETTALRVCRPPGGHPRDHRLT
jgi:hypothetical protein